MLEKPKSRYEQVAERLRNDIKQGKYPPGERLPSQTQLAREYGLAQTSIGRAIARLKNEGLVRVEDGKGATVLEVPTIKRVRRTPYRGKGGSFAQAMRESDLEPHTPLVSGPEVVTPSAEVATYLQMGEGQVIRRERHMFGSGHPMQIAVSHIPISAAGSLDIADTDTNPTGMYERLAQRGHKVTRFQERIEVRHPTEKETVFFGITDSTNVLEVVRTAYDQDERPVDVTFNVFPATQWALTYEWNAHE